jgi:protein arginine N-methyltransferase 3
MFCAKAGAKQVIAVDNSNILNKARENIFNNGLSSQIVCVKGRIEDVTLPVKEVDVIVSEWMGYCLLYEAMLPSVLWARDRYLKADGLMVPSHSSMWVAPVSDTEWITDHISFWHDVYGFDMKAMQEDIYVDSRVLTLPPTSLGGSAYDFRLLDLHTVKIEDLVFDVPWQSKMSADVDGLDGFLIWFDIFFAQTRNDMTVTPQITAKEWAAGGRHRVAFTTGPHGVETHWRQCLLVNKWHSETQTTLAGQEIKGRISYATPKDHARGLNITVSWDVQGTDTRSQQWLVN